MHVNVLVELNEIILTLLLPVPKTLKNIYKKDKGRVADSVSLDPLKIGLLHLSHPSIFRTYSYKNEEMGIYCFLGGDGGVIYSYLIFILFMRDYPSLWYIT